MFPSGILSVDAAVPIGRGQRQLILGDRAKGKTTFALDAVLAGATSSFARKQFAPETLCGFAPAIFVVIGRRRSEVLGIISAVVSATAGLFLESLFVVAGAADVAPAQWVAPFTGVTFAEVFALSGFDSAVVFNDLSRHANAYRQISLLLRRPPAREAFPGDIFFLHARLLERCVKVCERLGSGSCTGLPVVETQEGELSAYIPTNIISITDGQVLLDNRLVNRGLQPAVNMGLSVSRIGSAAQLQYMKQSAGTLRLELALYRELEKNRQFKDQLDQLNRALLFKGDFLTVFFQQPKNAPGSPAISVALLRASAQEAFFSAFANSKTESINAIRVKKFKQLLYRTNAEAAFQAQNSALLSSVSVCSEGVSRAAGYSAESLSFFESTLVGALGARVL